jgi:hypothetical protein
VGISHLLRLQKKILGSIEEDLTSYSHRKPKDLIAYEKAYLREFRRAYKVANKEDLLARIRSSQIIFCGDFHSLRQSQKTAMRLLRDAVRIDSNYILCLECIDQKKQEVLDRFFLKEIDANELRELIGFDSTWPFPWENYKDLFLFSQEVGIQMVALGSGFSAGRENLSQRDLESAKIIVNTALRSPKHRLFVFYGDLHLAKKHLPSATKEIFKSNGKSLRFTTIFQNEPRLFWKLARDGLAHTTDVLKLSADTWCIMNTTPWVRLQSYLDWLEGDSLSGASEENGLSDNASGRITSMLWHLEKFLNLEKKEDIDVTIYSFENIEGFRALAMPGFSLRSKAIHHSIYLSRPGFIPDTKSLYIPSTSLNVLAEASALMLLERHKAGGEFIFDPRNNMASQILVQARIYFCSKIINPKRKCEETDDILNFLSANNRKRKATLRFKKNFYHWAQKELRWILEKSNRKFQPKGPRFTYASGCEAARLVGSILSERLHYAFLNGSFPLEEAQKFLLTAITNESSSRKLLLKYGNIASKSGYTIRSKLEKL